MPASIHFFLDSSTSIETVAYSHKQQLERAGDGRRAQLSDIASGVAGTHQTTHMAVLHGRKERHQSKDTIFSSSSGFGLCNG